MKTKTKASPRNARQSEYDSAWKDVIEEHFEPFLEFFFPHIHKDIDFTKKPEILSKELRKILPYSKIGKRYADVLIKVYLKDGSTKWICLFIHVEVQGTKDPGFMTRIFIYYYRIFEKYKDKGAKIISLAILTDEDEEYRPDEYHTEGWGFHLNMKIPLVKIIDYQNQKELREKLDISTNPMAMIVKAQLNSYEAKKGDDNVKYDIKRDLIRQCYKYGYDQEYIRSLFNFIDLIFRLPEGLEKKLFEEISRIEEELKMPYVTSWEKIAKKQGRKEGRQEGRQEGWKEGWQEGKLETARELIKNGVGIDIVAKSTGLPRQVIEKL